MSRPFSVRSSVNCQWTPFSSSIFSFAACAFSRLPFLTLSVRSSHLFSCRWRRASFRSISLTLFPRSERASRRLAALRSSSSSLRSSFEISSRILMQDVMSLLIMLKVSVLVWRARVLRSKESIWDLEFARLSDRPVKLDWRAAGDCSTYGRSFSDSCRTPRQHSVLSSRKPVNLPFSPRTLSNRSAMCSWFFFSSSNRALSSFLRFVFSLTWISMDFRSRFISSSLASISWFSRYRVSMRDLVLSALLKCSSIVAVCDSLKRTKLMI